MSDVWYLNTGKRLMHFFANNTTGLLFYIPHYESKEKQPKLLISKIVLTIMSTLRNLVNLDFMK